jgi:hypothetical protein
VTSAPPPSAPPWTSRVLPGNAFPLTAATTAVPMTPEVQAVIRARRRGGWWPSSRAYWVQTLIIIGVSLYFLGSLVLEGLQTGFHHWSWGLWVLFAPLVLVSTVSLLFRYWHRGALARDAQEKTYLRTSGPVELVKREVDEESDSVVFSVGTKHFDLSDYSEAAAALKDLAWASVDYTRHARLILSITDATGGTVYCEQG